MTDESTHLEEADDSSSGRSAPLDGGFVLRKWAMKENGAEVEVGVNPKRQYDVSNS